MVNLGEFDIFIFITQLGIIIFTARLCGEIAKRLGQPIIFGEIVAGILLGPLVFGNLFPEMREIIFPTTGISAFLLQGVSWLCALFILLIAGLEIDFWVSLRYGKQNILTSLFGFLFPFFAIIALADILPKHFYPQTANPGHANLLLATALSVASVPVIGKILFDLKMFHSYVGLNIITSSVMSDIWEWSTILVILALIHEGTITAFAAIRPIILMATSLYLAITLGQRTLEKLFKFLKIQSSDTAAILALLFSVMLLNSALAHLIGLHVAYGAFLTGLMIGESLWITPHMRQSIQDFVFGVFAPIFFVCIGMQLQLTGASDWVYVALLFAVASVGKIGGAFFGALLGGLGRKNALAVGCGLNAQGAMGIVVALIGVDTHMFSETLFSIVVVISVVSSLLVGPSLKWAVKGIRRPLATFFDPKNIFINVAGRNKKEIFETAVNLMAERHIIKEPERIREAIWQREKSLSTAIGDGIALPHARLARLKKPILCFFKLATPVDFNSPDNVPVQLVFLELTDKNDEGMQLQLISQITRFLSVPRNKEKLIHSTTEQEIYQVLSFDENI